MTATPRNRKLDTISDRIYRASEAVPAALAHLALQRSYVPPLVSSTTDGVAGGKSGHNDRTLRLAERLETIDHRSEEILHLIVVLEKKTNLLDQAIRDAYKLQTDPDVAQEAPSYDERPLCRGGQPDTWGDTTCGELVESYTRDDGTIGYRGDGLCVRHRSAKRRWDKRTEEEAA